MRTVLRIAVNVFRESVRDKVLYNLVGFAILMIGVSLLIGQLTAGQEVKIIKDLGLASVSVFGTFIAIFIGIGLVSKEVEKRSIYALIAKPLSRTQLVLGKFVGLALTLAVNVGVMTLAIFAVLLWWDQQTVAAVKAGWEAPALDPAMLTAVFLIYLELLVVTAIAIVFSTYSSAILSAAFTFGLVIAGHFSRDLRNFYYLLTVRCRTSSLWRSTTSPAASPRCRRPPPRPSPEPASTSRPGDRFWPISRSADSAVQVTHFPCKINVTIPAFGVDRMVLYSSLLERAGAVHTPVAVFPAS